MNILKDHKGGIIGCVLLLGLIMMSFYAIFIVTPQQRAQWNNPLYWTENPKNAEPEWINLILRLFNYPPLPKHIIIPGNEVTTSIINESDFKLQNYTFSYKYDSNEFPSNFNIPYSVLVGKVSPVIELYVKRPDNTEFKIYSNSLYSSNNASDTNNNTNTNLVTGKIFSTAAQIRDSLYDYSGNFRFSTSDIPAENILFSKTSRNEPLNGNYRFIFSLYTFDNETTLKDLKFVLGGKVFGVLGTDSLGRDIFFGLLIGTPVALFIGISVALSSSFIGLFYGLISGYKGKKTSMIMLTLVDIFISIPSFILLIIISLNFGRNLLILIGLFIIFGWPGLALLNRTFSIQLKNYQYVEASKLMGEKDFRIVMRHMVPQLLAFTLANFALSVPSAILLESALSFLGLGDPSFPTWGQMLEDAHSFSAEIKGYWWWVLAPGFMISLTSVAFILIGRSLENIVKFGKNK